MADQTVEEHSLLVFHRLDAHHGSAARHAAGLGGFLLDLVPLDHEVREKDERWGIVDLQWGVGGSEQW